MSEGLEKIRESIPDVSPILNNAAENISSIKQNVQSSLGDFSSKDVINASNDFLSTNGLLARFAFIILVLFGFMFLFRIGVTLIGYMMSPSSNPFIISGKINGANSVLVSQNPANTNSVIVYRSNDQGTGMEYTWSLWLYLRPITTGASGACNYGTGNKQNCVFVKGNAKFDNNGINLLNGPGLYVSADQNTGIVKLKAVMDIMSSGNNKEYRPPNSVEVDNIPIQKWVHVALRLENTVLDVYINGVIANRIKFENYPQQNYNDINVCANGGFPGELSDLRYFARALNVFEINNIIVYGPNLASSPLSTDSTSASGNYSYLSNQWYSSKM